MPLPELRYKPDHMPKSMVQILPNNKCEVERETEIGRQAGGKEKGTEKDYSHHHMGSLMQTSFTARDIKHLSILHTYLHLLIYSEFCA